MSFKLEAPNSNALILSIKNILPISNNNLALFRYLELNIE
jgi:hypothetical protein